MRILISTNSVLLAFELIHLVTVQHKMLKMFSVIKLVWAGSAIWVRVHIITLELRDISLSRKLGVQHSVALLKSVGIASPLLEENIK